MTQPPHIQNVMLQRSVSTRLFRPVGMNVNPTVGATAFMTAFSCLWFLR
uniref:Uncharacterized protein n=1 Tax=Anguilla anguilla TaxID=7936 RepID=A0A0E9TC94_ANGAN